MNKNLTDEQLVQKLIEYDKKQSEIKKESDALKAELMNRGLARLGETNTKYTKFYGGEGTVAIVDTQTLEILNLPAMRRLLGKEFVDQFVTIETKKSIAIADKFKKALMAIASGDYTFEYSLDEFLVNQMECPSEKLDGLRKKLKGDYKSDLKVLSAVFPEKTDFTVELFYIYKIKMGELIKGFISDDTESVCKKLKEYLLTDFSVKIQLDYENK